MPDPSPTSGQPGPNPGQPATAEQPAPPLDPAARRAATRAAILAGAAGPKPASTQAPAAPAPVAPVQLPPAAGADPGRPVAAAPPPVDEPNDPAAVLRRQEQHNRRQMAQERQQMQADFEVQRQQWQTKLDEHAKLKALIDKRDPLALAAAAGWTEADFEGIAQTYYAASPEGKKDPNRARAAQALLEKRQEQSRVDKLESEFSEYRKTAEQREQQAAQQAQAQAVAARWLDTVHGAAGDDTPIARSASDKAALNQRLLAETDRLWQESGPSDDLREMPTPTQVIRAYETRRRAELEALRPEYEALAKLTAPPPAAPAAAPAPADAAPAPTNHINGEQTRRARLVAGIQAQRRQGS